MKNFIPIRTLLIPLFIIVGILLSGFFQDPKNEKITAHYSAEDYTRDSLILSQYEEGYYYHWRKLADYDSMFYFASKMYEHSGEMLEKQYDSLTYSYYTLSYCFIGYANVCRGKYDEVEEYIEGAIKLTIDKFGESSMVLRPIYIGFNAFLAEKGEYGKAEEQLEKALRLIEINHGGRHSKIPGAYWNLGLLNEKKGDYEQATKYYQKSADILILNNLEQRTARCYDRIGSFQQWEGSYTLAIKNFNKALTLKQQELNPQPFHFTFLYLRLAAVYLELGDTEKANEYFELAPKVENYKSIGRNHFNLESNYSDLGDIYLKRKEFHRAAYFYQKLFEIAKYYRGSNHIILAEVYNQIGKLHIAKEEPDSALIVIQKALTTLLPDFQADDITLYPEVKRVGVGFALPASIALKAKALKLKHQQTQNLDDLKLALKGFQIATDYIDLMRSDYLTEASKQTLAERARIIYKNGIETSMELYQKTQDDKYINQALELMEKSKSILLLETIQKSNASEFAGISKDFLSNEHQIKMDLAFYEKVLSEEEKKVEADALKIDNYKGKIFKLHNDYDHFITQMKKNHPEYYQLKYDLTVADIPSIQKHLSNKSALIEYFFSDDVLWTFGITKREVVFNKFAIGDNFLKKLETTRDLLRNNPNSGKNASQIQDDYIHFIKNSSELYDILLKPVLKNKNVTQLTIIPDGPLGYLPFQILLNYQSEKTQNGKIDYRNLPYLFKEYEINYEYSSSILLAKSAYKKTKNIYAGFAPKYHDNEQLALRGDERSILEDIYDETVRDALNPLKHNQPEVEYSREIIGGKSFLGTFASEQAFKANAKNSQILHLAMHALTNDVKPLYSQLIFSESTDSTEDGNLHAYELYNMQLNADLAVLSACNTGTGKLQRGEGIMSLARAFKYAGCPNIVMSLWKANDESTKDIMVDFYRNLKEGEGKGDALKNAKLNYLETADQKYTHPYYWATFVLIGDNEPIDFGRPWWMNALFGLGGLALLIIVYRIIRKKQNTDLADVAGSR